MTVKACHRHRPRRQSHIPPGGGLAGAVPPARFVLAQRGNPVPSEPRRDKIASLPLAMTIGVNQRFSIII
jgi:hypothetical protein